MRNDANVHTHPPVTGFGIVLDTSPIGSLALTTGALPAEFGLRTVGLVDITSRNDIFNNSGSVSLYDGSRGTIAQPTLRAATALAGWAAAFPLC